MKIKHESFENVGIFTISGELSSDHEDNLKLLLMKAVHGISRSVLNFRGVNRINRNCLKLLNKAYRTSLRLKNPIIMTEVPETYLPEIFSCKSLNSAFVRLNNKTKKDSGKIGVLSGVN
jgi:anti-anti-sigma regulatory factor